MTVSVLVATLGRPTLERTLSSITSQFLPGDQVLVIGATQAIGDRATAAGCTFLQCPPGRNWGGQERAVGIQHTTGDYVCFLDDDDVYVPGARAAMAEAMTSHPGQPTIFKMHIAWTGGHLWAEPALRMGNVGTPMLFLPNDARAKAGQWGMRYGNDFGFIQSLNLAPASIQWNPTVIASIRPKEGA